MSKLTKWKVLTAKTIHETSWIKIIEEKCQANSKTLTYTYTKRVDEGPLIIPEAKENLLYMVRQYRHPIRKIIWQFPAEGKFSNESWHQAARRGVEEEVGLIPGKLIDLGVLYPDPGGLQQKTRLFIARNLKTPAFKKKKRTEKGQEEEEKLEVKKFTRKQIDKLIEKGEICDNWTLSALFLYDAYKQSLLKK